MNEQELKNRKQELEILIESQRQGKEKGFLSDFGIKYLEGLEEAYNIIFPRTMCDKRGGD